MKTYTMTWNLTKGIEIEHAEAKEDALEGLKITGGFPSAFIFMEYTTNISEETAVLSLYTLMHMELLKVKESVLLYGQAVEEAEKVAAKHTIGASSENTN